MAERDGFQVPTCANCSHAIGDHKSAGTHWPHPPLYGVCLRKDCTCTEFVEVPSSRKKPHHEVPEDHPDGNRPVRPDVAAGRGRSPVVLERQPLSGDRYVDAVKDARAELASEEYVSPRDAVIASLNACHGNGDMYPLLKDRQRHPYGLPTTTPPERAA